MNNTQYKITDESHTNFSIIPNCVDDMNLSPYAYRLYGHIKRVAGEHGNCWQSGDTLCKICNMSTGQISKAKKELLERRLIKIEVKHTDRNIYHDISIIDIWNQNSLSPSEPPSPSEKLPSPSETIKNPIKKNQESEIPDDLNVSEFVETWSNWVEYRREIKHKLTESTIKQQLKMLRRFGPDIGAAMLNQSIQNGWQGIFELKGISNNESSRITNGVDEKGNIYG
jgi:hypothetical protein